MWFQKKPKEEIVYKIIKIIIWCLPLLILIGILNAYFVPSGKLGIKYDITKGSKFVRNFASKEVDKLIGTENTAGNKDYFQLITTTPVYFDVKVPRPFKSATVKLTYQNPDSQPLVQLGIQQANKAYVYKNLAMSNTILDNMPVYWDKIQEGSTVLWQINHKFYQEKMAKQKIFDSRKKVLDTWENNELKKLDETSEQYELQKQAIEDKYQQELRKIAEDNDMKVSEKDQLEYENIQNFFSNLPDKNKIIQFNYDMSSYFEISGYKKSSKVTVLDKSIRGRHEILTYIGKDEDLNFSFTLQDINRHEDADPFKVVIYDQLGRKIKEASLSDDGDVKADGKVLPERVLNILLEKIPLGVYRIVLDINDDLFIKKIVTFQHLLIFKQNIYLTDNPEYKDIIGNNETPSSVIFTSGSYVQARTSHQANLQTLIVGGRELKISKLNESPKIDNLKNITQIFVPKNDVYLESDGYFAFSREQMFDPIFSVVPSLENVKNIDDYDYIIANYPQPQVSGNWLVAEATVESPQLYFHKDGNTTVGFMLNLPGLPENHRFFKIKEIDIEFSKESVTIVNFFPKVVNKLKSIFQK